MAYRVQGRMRFLPDWLIPLHFTVVKEYPLASGGNLSDIHVFKVMLIAEGFSIAKLLVSLRSVGMNHSD
ncbi:MAG: hypothetical protein JSW12_02265 [Deltaproteobacteria bacterium]|nr:MAG: hypothetical protein JSW12_02265 [Deltaproteobacteria bacterium]